jgi:hypothetical protein
VVALGRDWRGHLGAHAGGGQGHGESLTVFLRGCYAVAVQLGATLFDDVRVVDLGP